MTMKRLVVCILLVGLVGCASTSSPPTPQAQPTPPAIEIDSVADRLHDISGSLLLFYHAQRRLPVSLAELSMGTGLSARQLIDLATGQPFSYNPAGFGDVAGAGRIIVASAQQDDSEFRWCVVIDTSAATPLCRVLPVPLAARPETSP